MSQSDGSRTAASRRLPDGVDAVVDAAVVVDAVVVGAGFAGM